MTQLKNQKLGNYLLNNSWGKSLAQVEFALLCLVIAVLPTFEAPKQIFWGLYFITAITRLLINRSLLDFKWPDLFFGLWFASALASTLGAGMPGQHEWKGFKDLFMYSSTAWLVYRSNYTTKQLENILILTIISVIPPLLWGAWLYLGPAQKAYLELKSVGHVNHSSIYLAIVYGICLSFFLCLRKKLSFSKRLFFAIVLLLLFSSIVIGQSRAAFGITILVSFLLIFLLSSTPSTKILGFGFFISVMIIIFFTEPLIFQKQKDTLAANNILSNRNQVWNVSLEAARWSPLLGLGMNNWKLINRDTIKESVEKRGGIYQANNYHFAGHSHNIYLSILVERGILGLSTFVLIILAWGTQLAKSYRFCNVNGKLMFWGSSLSTYILAIGIGMVNTTIHHEHGLLTALCLGIFLATTGRIKN